MFNVTRPPLIRVNDRVAIPQENHPEINFVGLLIGPRGNTLRNIEKEVCNDDPGFSHFVTIHIVVDVVTYCIFTKENGWLSGKR